MTDQTPLTPQELEAARAEICRLWRSDGHIPTSVEYCALLTRANNKVKELEANMFHAEDVDEIVADVLTRAQNSLQEKEREIEELKRTHVEGTLYSPEFNARCFAEYVEIRHFPWEEVDTKELTKYLEHVQQRARWESREELKSQLEDLRERAAQECSDQASMDRIRSLPLVKEEPPNPLDHEQSK